jgi:hypothetical protein
MGSGGVHFCRTNMSPERIDKARKLGKKAGVLFEVTLSKDTTIQKINFKAGEVVRFYFNGELYSAR